MIRSSNKYHKTFPVNTVDKKTEVLLQVFHSQENMPSYSYLKLMCCHNELSKYLSVTFLKKDVQVY